MKTFVIEFRGDEFVYYTTQDSEIILNENHYLPNAIIENISSSSVSSYGQNIIDIKIIDNLNLTVEMKVDVFLLYNNRKLSVFRGAIVEILRDNLGQSKIRCISNVFKLLNKNSELFSSSCRAEFGDMRCGKDITQYSFIYTVDDVRQNIIIFNNDKEDSYFENGLLIDANDKKYRILKHHKNQIEISDLIDEKINKHDSIKLIAGCNKSFSTCKNKFQNAINFVGEPFFKKI